MEAKVGSVNRTVVNLVLGPSALLCAVAAFGGGSGDGSSGLSHGAIAGIVVGSVVGAALLAAIAVFIVINPDPDRASRLPHPARLSLPAATIISVTRRLR